MPPTFAGLEIAEGHLFLGEMYAETGRKEKAMDALEHARTGFREMGMDYWVMREERARDKLAAA